MLIPDVNVVLAAAREDHAEFSIARRWLDDTVERGEPFSILDSVAASFVRVVTNFRVFRPASTASEAFAVVRSIRAQPGHVRVEPGPRHLDHLEAQIASADASGDLVSDALLAAVAVEHNATIVSFDRDFARFRDIRWLNPKDEPPSTHSAR